MKICTHGHRYDADAIGDLGVCPIKDCGHTIIDCDDGMVPIVVGLNKLGYRTIHSCAGHFGGKLYDMYVTIGTMTKAATMNFVSMLLSYSYETPAFRQFGLTVFAVDRLNKEFLYKNTIFFSEISSECKIAEELSKAMDQHPGSAFIVKIDIDKTFSERDEEDIDNSSDMIFLYNKLTQLHKFVEWLTERIKATWTEEGLTPEEADLLLEKIDDDDFEDPDDPDPVTSAKLDAALKALDRYSHPCHVSKRKDWTFNLASGRWVFHPKKCQKKCK